MKSRSKRIESISPEDTDRIIKMALEDRTSFESLETQFGLTPNDTVVFMRKHLSAKSFMRWRKRISERGHLKHRAKNGLAIDRFKSKNQRVDGSIKVDRRGEKIKAKNRSK